MFELVNRKHRFLNSNSNCWSYPIVIRITSFMGAKMDMDIFTGAIIFISQRATIKFKCEKENRKHGCGFLVVALLNR